MNTTLRADVEYQTRLEINELGRAMVRVDTAIQDAKRRDEWTEVEDLTDQRYDLQEHRSQLMRDVFVWRHSGQRRNA